MPRLQLSYSHSKSLETNRTCLEQHFPTSATGAQRRKQVYPVAKAFGALYETPQPDNISG